MNGYNYRYQIIDIFDVLTIEKSHQARLWCREKFGKEYDQWGVFIDGFNFINEKDFTLFLLRWS